VFSLSSLPAAVSFGGSSPQITRIRIGPYPLLVRLQQKLFSSHRGFVILQPQISLARHRSQLSQEKIPIQLKLGRSEQTLNSCGVRSLTGALPLVLGFSGCMILKVQITTAEKRRDNQSIRHADNKLLLSVKVNRIMNKYLRC
jgi:hypothetical protein